MTAPILPALAREALTDDCAGVSGALVAARTGRVLHALADSGRSLTPTGRLSRTTRPLCGRRPRRSWRAVEVDGRPLCRTCTRVLRGLYGPAALATAATWLLPSELATTITTCPDLVTLGHARLLLIESGHTGKSVTLPDGQLVRLTALVAQTRARLESGPRLTERDRAWFSAVKNAPASRFPRRVS